MPTNPDAGQEGGARLPVRVRPGAKRNGVAGFLNGAWKVQVAAPPHEGRANNALIEFLSEVLDTPKSSISILRGETGRDKLIAVSGLSQPEADARLKAAVKDG